ncbi:MAG: hypothetical protein ABSG07_19550 [Terriglobales bacterium]|jgi:hypothetical protein
MIRHKVVGAEALVVLALLWNGSSGAQVGDTGAGRREMVRGDLGIDSRTILGVTLGRSNLAEVQATLGRARLWSDGDASTAEGKVCYVTQEPDAEVVIFASNLEMAGPPENQVTDIRISKSSAYVQRAKCLPLPISAEKVHTKSGLGIGLSHRDIRRILATPQSATPKGWEYSWSIDVPLPASDKYYEYWRSREKECFDGKEPFFSIGSTITVEFEGDAVTALSLSRGESIC